VSDETLSRRALGRATLERQLLLRRSDMALLDAVGHLVGMQAQMPMKPYVGLWSRLDRFQPERPRNGKALRSALRERFPDHDAAALAYACRNRLALVQVPPRGLWGRSAQVTSTRALPVLGAVCHAPA